MLSGVSLDIDRVIHLLNVYCPHINRVSFWNRLKSKGILASKSFVIAGDLNLTTGADEI